MKVLFKSVVPVVLVMVLTSCATLLANKHPQVRINSAPAGANVYVNGDFVGVTPIKLKLKNDNQFYTIEFRKDGYLPRTYTLEKHIGGIWFVLDMLAGSFQIAIDDVSANWFVLMDNVSGNWYVLDTDDVSLVLLQ